MNNLEQLKQLLQQASGHKSPEVKVVGETVTFTKLCRITNEFYSVTISVPQYLKWKAGAHIQDITPLLGPDEREFIISGMTPAEWNEMFKIEEDAEDEYVGIEDNLNVIDLNSLYSDSDKEEIEKLKKKRINKKQK